MCVHEYGIYMLGLDCSSAAPALSADTCTPPLHLRAALLRPRLQVAGQKPERVVAEITRRLPSKDFNQARGAGGRAP